MRYLERLTLNDPRRPVRTLAGRRPFVLVGHGDEATELLRGWTSANPDAACQLTLFRASLDPPCALASLAVASAVLVDGVSDLSLAIAECSRLQSLPCPIGLVTPAGVSELVARRAGIDVVISVPGRADDLARFFSLSKEFERLDDRSPDLPRPVSRIMPPVGSLGRLTERVTLNWSARTLLVDGKEEVLSAQKYDLLCYFLDRPGVAVAASELVKNGLLRPSQAQRFKGLMQELRSHLGPARGLIRPVLGYGYRLDLNQDLELCHEQEDAHQRIR